MRKINHVELLSVSGGDFTGLFATSITFLTTGMFLGYLFDPTPIPIFTPIGRAMAPNANCMITQAGVGAAVFGAFLATTWMVATALDESIYNGASISPPISFGFHA